MSLFSQNCDREVADMIEIQEDLARQIATAMQTSMDHQRALADMAQVGTRSVEAYQAYMLGVAGTVSLEPSDYKVAYELFEQARQLDPSFAVAHARAAAFWLEQMDPTGVLNDLTDLPPREIGRKFGERIDLAIRHESGETAREGYRALKAVREQRLREAIELCREYLTGRPGDAAAVNELLSLAAQVSDQALLANTLDAFWKQAQATLETALSHANFASRALDKRKAADQAMMLLQRWQEQRALLYQIHRALLWDGQVEAAGAVLRPWLALHDDTAPWSTIPSARQACAEGRRAEVERQLEALPEDDVAQRWHMLMLLGRTADAADLLQSLERAGDTYALAGFLVYPQFDPTPFPSLIQVPAREKVERPPPLAMPFACPPKP